MDCGAIHSHNIQMRIEHTKPPSGKHSSWTLSDSKSPGLNIDGERNFLDMSLRKTEEQGLLGEDRQETLPCPFAITPGTGACG